MAAGARADQGDLAGAIEILARTGRRVGRVQERHLRQWYALADLHERAGDLPRARDLFTRVAATDPDAFDVRARIRSLALIDPRYRSRPPDLPHLPPVRPQEPSHPPRSLPPPARCRRSSPASGLASSFGIRCAGPAGGRERR